LIRKGIEYFYKIKQKNKKKTMSIQKVMPIEKNPDLVSEKIKIEYAIKQCAKEHESRIKSIAFHPNQSLMLIGFFHGGIHMYDYDQKKVIAKYMMPAAVRGICFHPTESKFAAGGNNHNVCIYDYVTDEQLTLRGHEDYVRSVSFHPTQPLLASCGDDSTVRIWDTESGECIGILMSDVTYHYFMSVTFAPKSMFGQDDIVIACNLKGETAIWKLDKLTNTTPELTLKIRLKRLIGKIGDGKILATPEVSFGSTKGANGIACHPTQKIIASCSDDNTIRIYNRESLETDSPKSIVDWKTVEPENIDCHTAPVSAIAFISDYNLLVGASEDGSAIVYDFTQHDLVRRIQYAYEDIENGQKRYRNLPVLSRCWAVASHPSKPMFAIGHDYGFSVYTVEKKELS
jgi:coatomer protein complex subunit alpha (xenin)